MNLGINQVSDTLACSTLIIGQFGEYTLTNDPTDEWLETEDNFFESFENSWERHEECGLFGRRNPDHFPDNVTVDDWGDEVGESLRLEDFACVIASLSALQVKTRGLLESIGFVAMGPFTQNKNFNDEDENPDVYLMVISAADLGKKFNEYRKRI